MLANHVHDVIFQGVRLTSFRDVTIDTPRDELAFASKIIKGVTGSQSTGFHVPYVLASEGTVESASDLGIDWLAGGGDTDTLPGHEPTALYGHQLLERGTSQRETFQKIDRALEEPGQAISHPNVQYFHNAMDALDNWAADRSLVPKGSLSERHGTVGLLCDFYTLYRVAGPGE